MKQEVISKPFREGHLDLFACVPKYQQQCDESVDWMIALGKTDQCGSIMIGHRILYIGAFFTVASGVVEVFILPSIYVEHYVKSFYSHVKWWLSYLISQPGVRRLQTWGEDTEDSARWLSHLGFKREGTLYCYGPVGENTTIWGIVK